VVREFLANIDSVRDFVLFGTSGAMADATTEDVWDIGNIGAESELAVVFKILWCDTLH